MSPHSEVAECHFQHLLRASHSFPRKQEVDLQGRLGACRDTHSSPTCYLSNFAQGFLYARRAHGAWPAHFPTVTPNLCPLEAATVFSSVPVSYLLGQRVLLSNSRLRVSPRPCKLGQTRRESTDLVLANQED